MAFADQAPLAQHHILVVPKKHVGSIRDVGPEDTDLLTDLVETANKVAEIQGIATSGYRVVINSGADAGQTVFHLHLHVLGGESLSSFGR